MPCDGASMVQGEVRCVLVLSGCRLVDIKVAAELETEVEEEGEAKLGAQAGLVLIVAPVMVLAFSSNLFNTQQHKLEPDPGPVLGPQSIFFILTLVKILLNYSITVYT